MYWYGVRVYAFVGVYAFVVTSLALTFVFQIIISLFMYRHMYIVHSLARSLIHSFRLLGVLTSHLSVYSVVHVGTYYTYSYSVYMYVDDGLFILCI